MLFKAYDVQDTEKKIGWASRDLKWLSPKEASVENKKRNRLLDSLEGRAQYSFLRNKLHTGPLSPGCMTCGQGTWSCLYINGLCTARCFFCPQDRDIKKERLPLAEGLGFNDPGNYTVYLEKCGFHGMGVSGGETLLVFEKLLRFIKTVKKHFGNRMHTWIYTNGHLATDERLRKLKDAGLDEIRFNLSANRYNLGPVGRAARFMRTVTVEIPMIPEDEAIVKNSLKPMRDLGVRHLNLHQLTASEFNYKNFAARGYTFLHHANIPVLESEMAALRTIQFALKHRIDLPINYCTGPYKAQFQGSAHRRRGALAVAKPYETLTESGYLRRLSFEGLPINIRSISKILARLDPGRNRWHLSDTGTQLLVHEELLPHFSPAKLSLSLTYFLAMLSATNSPDGESVEIAINPNLKLYVNKNRAAIFDDLNPVALKAFKLLYLEGGFKDEARNLIFQQYDLRTKEDLNKMQKAWAQLEAMATFEKIAPGFPEIF